MPCLNAGRYLRPCLDSVVDQLGPRDELIVQDALSTDGSAEVLDSYAGRTPKMLVVHEKDGGQSDALNRALKRARGDYVWWVNADDLVLPGAFDLVRAEIERAPHLPDVVVGGWRLVDGGGEVVRESPARELDRGRLLVQGCYAFSGAMLVRRDLLLLLRGYSRDLHYVMDFDLMLKLADTAQVVVPRPLGALRYHDASKSGGLGRRFFTEGAVVRWRGRRSDLDVVRAVAGTAWHAAGVATARVRFGPAYTRLRERWSSRAEPSA
ncbi:glycosyltransferase [Lentzea sp.]|uniref:glycosyltransferase n=1 Tax=Lentzea sp. TaxID=56099 RepID=UPI002ED4ADED